MESGCIESVRALFRCSKIVERPKHALERCFRLRFLEASDGSLKSDVIDLLGSPCGRVLVGSRIVVLRDGVATLSLSEASKLFSNKQMWRCICVALSEALQRHLKSGGRLLSTEREEIELLQAAASTRAKKRKLRFDEGTLSLANAPPCVKDVLEKDTMRNDVRFHLGTICAELANLAGADNAKLLVDGLKEFISERHGARRAKHFVYHATRQSTFNRRCITMANAPVQCMLGPELCIKRRKINKVRADELTPSIVWAHKDSDN